MDVDGEQRPFCGGLGALCGVAVPKHQQDSRSRQAIAGPYSCGLLSSSRCAGVKLLPESGFSLYSYYATAAAHWAAASRRLASWEAAAPSLGLQRPHGGHPQTRRARARAREALAFSGIISARLLGALQTRRELIRDLGLPCGLLVSYTNAGVGAGRAIWPRPLVRAPYQNPHVRARSTPSSGGLPQRSGAPRSSGAARRGRVARGTAVSNSAPHAIAAAQYCAESSRTPGHKTTQKKQGTTLRPATPFWWR